MNQGYIAILLLLIGVSVLCRKSIKEQFKHIKLEDDAGQYSFIPYRTSFVRNLGQRGCENAKYWNCVDNHPETKDGYEINKVPEKIQNDCKRYSSDQCYFPEFISHARTEPYYQYFQYA